MAFPARHTTVVLAILFGVASLLVSQVGALGQEQGAPSEEPVEVEDGTAYSAGRLIVTYEPTASEVTESEAVEEVGGEVEEEIEPIDAEVVALPEVESEPPARRARTRWNRPRRSSKTSPASRRWTTTTSASPPTPPTTPGTPANGD